MNANALQLFLITLHIFPPNRGVLFRYECNTLCEVRYVYFQLSIKKYDGGLQRSLYSMSADE